MPTMNISLPESLMDFVEEQVDQRGFGTNSEYLCELIRKEQDRLRLRAHVLEAAASTPAEIDDAFFDGLRDWVRNAGDSSVGT